MLSLMGVILLSLSLSLSLSLTEDDLTSVRLLLDPFEVTSTEYRSNHWLAGGFHHPSELAGGRTYTEESVPTWADMTCGRL